jgi:hypothetical protein
MVQKTVVPFSFGGIAMFNIKVIENELTTRSNHEVRFSHESYYMSDDFGFYRKLIVDNKDTGIKVRLDQLQEAEERGRLEDKYRVLLGQIQKVTNQ